MDLQKLYDKVPYCMQSVLFKLYCLKLYMKRQGKRFYEALDHLEETQWYSKCQLIEYQNEKLRQLIKHAYETVPYYHEMMKRMRLRPSDIKTIQDLPKLPILTKEIVSRNKEKLISIKYKTNNLIKGHTSGTTGTPLEFFWCPDMWFWNNVFDWRQKIWAGLSPGDPYCVFLGRTIVSTDRKEPPFWQYNPYENQLWCSSFHLSKRYIYAYINKIRAFRPVAMEGYPSTLSIMATLLDEVGETLPLRATLTSSETLYDNQKNIMRRIFKCPNFDFYGLAERVIFATECEAHCGKHLNMEYGITEVVDDQDQPLAHGEKGYLVGTSLWNYGMPFIRYKTSDISSIRTDVCYCGREMPLLDNVTTKAEDIIVTPDGRFISASVLTHPFKPLHHIRKSQIIQKERDLIQIKIVKRKGYTKKDSDLLLEEFCKRVGPGVQVELEFVEDIPIEKSGKFRWVISNAKKDYGALKLTEIQ